ncbi:hypothetical protein C0993_005575, partial [Termitomyces sp. T159_Od127]
GMNANHIAQRLSTAHTSVTNVIRTMNGRNEKGEEWDEVSAALMKDLSLPEFKESSTPQLQMPKPMMSTPSPKTVAAKRLWPLPTAASSSRSSPTFGVDDDARPTLLRPFGSPIPTSVEHLTTPPDLETFLSRLEHDMSELTSDLEAQGLETIEHLLAFAPWSEERLHELFKATIPDITIPQRFMLVHGLKKYA